MLASVFQTLKQKNEIDEEFIRHLVLNSYRMYRNKFHDKYGELVICHDATDYWRKDIFPQYKANRKKSMENSDVDWYEVFGKLDKIRNEIKETFPYKNIRVDRLEADDVIATICKKYHEQEKILIVSNDKDFQQLQRYPNIEQYSPIKKEFIKCEDPEQFLLEHIIKGDYSDGVPNILSDDDCIIDPEKRQKPCGKKKIAEIISDIDEWRRSEKWKRNQTIIDFNCLPEEYEYGIIENFNEEPTGKRSMLLNYFIKNKLKNLMENIGEF